MDRKPTSHLGHVVRISKNFGSVRHSISSEPFMRLISDSLRGGSNLRVPGIPTFRRTLGISRSENGSVQEQISVRGESSPMSLRSKRRPFCGEVWGLLAMICRFKKTLDCMVDQVESEPFSTSEFRQQIEFGPKLVQSPIPGYAARI